MLIGVSGKLGSGKDSLASMIIELDSTFQRKVFAEKLKQIVSLLSGRPIEDMYSQEGKNIYLPEWDMTVGNMLQQIGTDVMRNHFHNNVWVKALFADYVPHSVEKLSGSYEEYPNWIICDVRFKNEAQIIRDKGGILVRVNGDPAKIRENSTRDLNHQSETDLDDWDDWNIVVENNSTLEELRYKAQDVLRHTYDTYNTEPSPIKKVERETFIVLESEIDEHEYDYTATDFTWEIRGDKYTYLDKMRVDGDGEWYGIIVERERDRKCFQFDWGYGSYNNYYEPQWMEVKPIAEGVKRVTWGWI